jgi:hypothetical protein
MSWTQRVHLFTPASSDGHDVGVADGRVEDLNSHLVVFEFGELARVKFKVTGGAGRHPSHGIGLLDVAARIHEMAWEFFHFWSNVVVGYCL